MAVPGWLRRFVGHLVRPVGVALMVYGGVDMYLERNATRAHRRHPPVFPPGSDGPAPGHPERLCPDLPLTVQELLLARELEQFGWMLPRGHGG